MPNTSKIVVLIADDEPSTVAMLSSHLRSGGYAVLEASDGDQAWELAHQELPDLVILDVMMPGMSGWEVCRKVREAVSLAHTGVIMLTGIGESLNEMTSPLYGADAYVDKPFEFASLDMKIKETLARRKQGALGRPDAGGDEASMTMGEDDLPTLPPNRERATKTKPKPLAKTKPASESPAAAPAKAPKKAAPPAKKAPAKKAPAAKRASAKKAAPAPAKKAPAKKAPVAKKAAAKKALAKKAVAKKAPAKKGAAKKAPAKKAAAPAKKVVAKKSPAKKPVAKKAPAAAKKTKPAKKAGKKK
jgi:DNA-binding response OmpR family regulator